MLLHNFFGKLTVTLNILLIRNDRIETIGGLAEWSPAMAGRGVAETMWTYIIKSKKNGKYYIGQTSDIKKRLTEHNSGISRYTKFGVPWELIYSKQFKTRLEAVKFERKLKSYKGGNAFKKFIGGLAEWSKARGC